MAGRARGKCYDPGVDDVFNYPGLTHANAPPGQPSPPPPYSPYYQYQATGQPYNPYMYASSPPQPPPMQQQQVPAVQPPRHVQTIEPPASTSQGQDAAEQERHKRFEAQRDKHYAGEFIAKDTAAPPDEDELAERHRRFEEMRDKHYGGEFISREDMPPPEDDDVGGPDDDS